MSNVLPEEQKKHLNRTVRTRYVLVLALALGISAVVAAAALVPAFLSVRIAQAAVHADQAGTANHDDQAQLSKAQAYTNALSPLLAATSTPSETLGVALGLKPSGISVTSMSYSKGTIVLNGTSQSREGVSVYRDALQKSGRFLTVAVPVAALVGVQEGRFSITLTGAY